MPRLWWCVALAVQLATSGCLGQPPGGGGGPDAGELLDGGAAGQDGSIGSWDHLLYVSPNALPSPSLAIELLDGDYTFATDEPMWTGPGTPDMPSYVVVSQDDVELLVLSIDSLVIGATSSLRFTGSRPVMIVAWDDIDITGRIDVSSYPGDGSEAAGSPYGSCVATVSPGDGVGGTGGAMQGGGGAGGPSEGTAGPGGPGGIGVPAFPRGGCPGSDGANADSLLGRGGRAGGAVVLAALDTLTITGGIYAGGEGGGGGKMTDVVNYGGGGGGSGGLIVLQADTLRLMGSADLMAKGGGGGGGGGLAGQGDVGGAGYAPAAARGNWSAGGTGGTEGGGNGGVGGPNPANGLNGGSGNAGANGGGAGGGGGAGFILLRTPSLTLDGTETIMPAAIAL